MTPGYLLTLYGQIRAGSFVLFFAPLSLLALNPFVQNFRWPESTPR